MKSSTPDSSEMASNQITKSVTPSHQPHPVPSKSNVKLWWLIIAFIAAAVVTLMPQQDGLSIAGQRALAVLIFAVIVWLTEAVSYAVSALVILSMLTLLLGTAPATSASDVSLGTGKALAQALGGFSTPAWALVFSALFLAAAMQVTNLHRRIALKVMCSVGETTNSVLIGTIVISTILAFIVPSSTARTGAILPILLGLTVTFGLTKTSRFAALLVITAVHASSIWNIGIKTGAAQNILADGLITQAFGEGISWGKWFLAGAPWAFIMCIALFFIMKFMFKPEVDNLPGGKEVARQQLKELGKIRAEEWRLIAVVICLLFLWSTEKILHPLDSSTVTVVAIAFLLLPKVGVFTWKQANEYIDWGTVIVLGISISLGSLLLRSGAASWMSEAVLNPLGLDKLPIIIVIAITALFGILIHLGFASGSALTSVFIPIMIALAGTLNLGLAEQLGFVILMQFIVNFGFLLPISTPQGLLAYGTKTFTGRDFLLSGIPITIVGYIVFLILAATLWPAMGIL